MAKFEQKLKKANKDFLNMLKTNLKQSIYFEDGKNIDNLTDSHIEIGILIKEQISDFNVMINPMEIKLFDNDYERKFTSFPMFEESLSNLSLIVEIYKRGFEDGYKDGVSNGKVEIQKGIKKLLDM